MEAFGMYLLKSAVWLIGFGMVYLLFLRNERFFLLNRIYLLAGLLGSLFFPFIDWHYTIAIPVMPSTATEIGQFQNLITNDTSLTMQNLLLLLYFSGGGYLLFRIFKQTSEVWKVIRKTRIDTLKSVSLVRTTAYPTSFSFFTFVFVHPAINDLETEEIVNHEREHIVQKHWIDLLLFEMLLMIQWFNPICWLYGKLIRQNHEYLADEKALQKSSNPAIYRAALLNQMFGGSVISLAHSFNYSLNTKRFNMMKNSFNSPLRKLKLLLVIPLITTVFYAFATPEYVYISNKSEEPNLNISDQSKLIGESDLSSKTSGDIRKKSENIVLTSNSPKPSKVKTEESTLSKTGVKWVEPVGKWESDSVKKEGITIRGEAKNPLYIVDGIIKKNQSMKDINPETIESISVWKGEKAIEKYGEQARDGAIEITLKSGMPSNINYKAQSISVAGYKLGNKTNSDTSSHPSTFIRLNGNANVVRDGSKDEIQIRGVSDRPLLVVDGVIPENQNINSIEPGEIQSISVLKDKSATFLYGEKGKAGVIMITRKKSKSAGTSPNPKPSLTLAKPETDGQVEKISVTETAFAGQTSENSPLIVKDGKIAADQNIKEFGIKEALDKINILKGKEATDRYGEMGRNGVIEMTTKKEKLDLELPKTEKLAKETDPSLYADHKLIIITYADQKKAIVTLDGSSVKKRLEVNLFDKFGKLVQKESCKGPTFSYSLKNLATGSYFMVAEDGVNRYTGFLKY